MSGFSLARKLVARGRRVWHQRLPLTDLALRLARRRGVSVLCYHSLAPELDNYRWRTQAAAFDAHLAFLKDVFEIVPAPVAVQILKAGDTGTRDRPLAVICFDDGYRDNWTLATSILEKYDVPATLFVARDLILRSGQTHLSPEELVELAGHPLWQIGAHGTTHNVLPAFRVTDQEAEMRDSAEWLTEFTGQMPASFAYPQGQASHETVACARSMFDHAFTTDTRIGSGFDPFQIRRYCPVQDDDPPEALARALLLAPLEDGYS